MSGAAITWLQVAELLDAPTDLSQTIFKEMREKLSDKEWLKRSMRGDRANPRYDFAVEGVLSEGDKKLIVQEYTNAGWGFVNCTNSGEEGERPGMCGVSIQRLAPAKASTTSD